ncbi:polyisoprenoid-binding protein [Paeniglutamicibacter antarcticus]|uniref:Polyisoprenoid-binding protein n=1 Tax=Arthrobacter terrae TaxID=2935737 RepID=A0A931G6P0_9MICC|nr:YceI family protein [Arthrobacter terrae]MBG0741253.1 polyisoprenoid-binding protein [Arthrobacter terrae]
MTTITTTEFATLTGTYAIDAAHSRIGFVARHAMVTKVRGSFNDFEGTAVLDGSDLSKSTVTVTAQVASIDTRNEQRDGHLRTNDFLGAEQFPDLSFTSTSITHVGGNNFEVTGDLSIKGVTKSVTFPLEFQGAATDPFGNDRIGFEGATQILRSEYGVSFNAPLETGGVLVSDKITIELEISAVKSA